MTALFFIALIPAKAERCNELGIEISDKAGAVYLYSYDANRVLYSNAPDYEASPASSAKIMAGLVACEMYADKLDDTVEITDRMLSEHTGNSMGLRAGMKVTVKDLLYGTVCGCNNDAATALAIACSGSIDDFVKEMNALARRLYMKNTHYENPTGLDAEGAVTTLEDTALLVHKAAENEIYLSASSAVYFDFTPEGEKTVTVNNRNALVNTFSAQGYKNRYAKGIISGKTDEGGYVLATLAEKDGCSYLCLIMGAQEDKEYIYSYHTANLLLDRVFDDYSYKTVLSAGEALDSLEVGLALSDGEAAQLSLVLDEELRVFVSSEVDVKNDLTFVTHYHSDELVAPISKASVLGGVDVYYGDILVGKGRLVASEDVEPNSLLLFLNSMKDFLTGRTFIIALVISIPLLTLYIFTEARRSRHKKVGTLRFNKFS